MAGWRHVEGEGRARPRPKARVERRHLREVMASIGTLQLDAVNVLERTQFLVLFSRLGPYDVGHLHDMTGPGGELFEYWGHAASLLPMVVHPLFRWRMQRFRAGRPTTSKYEAARRAWRGSPARLIPRDPVR